MKSCSELKTILSCLSSLKYIYWKNASHTPFVEIHIDITWDFHCRQWWHHHSSAAKTDRYLGFRLASAPPSLLMSRSKSNSFLDSKPFIFNFLAIFNDLVPRYHHHSSGLQLHTLGCGQSIFSVHLMKLHINGYSVTLPQALIEQVKTKSPTVPHRVISSPHTTDLCSTTSSVFHLSPNTVRLLHLPFFSSLYPSCLLCQKVFLHVVCSSTNGSPKLLSTFPFFNSLHWKTWITFLIIQTSVLISQGTVP